MKKVLIGEIIQINEGSELMSKRIWDYRKNTEKIMKIMVEYPMLLGGKTREILTGIQFDTAYLTMNFFDNSLHTNAKKAHTLVNLKFYRLNDEVSLEDLMKYKMEHNDIEKFREELTAIKIEGERRMQIALENEKQIKEEAKQLKKVTNQYIKQILYR